MSPLPWICYWNMCISSRDTWGDYCAQSSSRPRRRSSTPSSRWVTPGENRNDVKKVYNVIQTFQERHNFINCIHIEATIAGLYSVSNWWVIEYITDKYWLVTCIEHLFSFLPFFAVTNWDMSYRSGPPNSKSLNSNVCIIQTFIKISANFLYLQC